MEEIDPTEQRTTEMDETKNEDNEERVEDVTPMNAKTDIRTVNSSRELLSRKN